VKVAQNRLQGIAKSKEEKLAHVMHLFAPAAQVVTDKRQCKAGTTPFCGVSRNP
jgi:hypothetical protein